MQAQEGTDSCIVIEEDVHGICTVFIKEGNVYGMKPESVCSSDVFLEDEEDEKDIEENEDKIPMIVTKQEDKSQFYYDGGLTHVKNECEEYICDEAVSDSCLFIKEEKADGMEDRSIMDPTHQPEEISQCESKTDEKQTSKKLSKLKYSTRICPHCDHIADNGDQLTLHIVTCHKNLKAYECPQCDYKGAALNHLRRHINYRHKTEKLHQCPLCDYKAVANSMIKSHIKYRHTDDKPHHCPYCDYKAVETGHIKRHIKHRHTTMKTHQCPHCDYKAVLNRMIKSHIKYRHSGEKPYKCPYCEYKTVDKCNVKKHIMSRHTGEKPYQCSQCDFKTTRSSCLKKHIRIRHSRGKPNSRRVIKLIKVRIKN